MDELQVQFVEERFEKALAQIQMLQELLLDEDMKDLAEDRLRVLHEYLNSIIGVS